MTPSTSLGAAAIGVVCGWWCAPLAAAHARSRSWGAAAGAMIAIWAESVAFGGRAAGIALLIGFLAGVMTHAGFRAVLAARFDPHRS